jgi:hypothetical protein
MAIARRDINKGAFIPGAMREVLAIAAAALCFWLLILALAP